MKKKILTSIILLSLIVLAAINSNVNLTTHPITL